jgi:hypothetical protein
VTARTFVLTLLPGPLAVSRLEPGDPAPPWAVAPDRSAASLVSITWTRHELSVVCPAEWVPAGVTASAPWRALRVEGPFDLSDVGVLAALAAPLARAGVSVLPIATHDTDYLLVRDDALPAAARALRADGHDVRTDGE